MKRKSHFSSDRGSGRIGPRQQELSHNALPAGSPELASAFTRALALHQAGRLTEAERGYRQCLKVQANHFDSLHLLGVIYHQRGNHAGAVHQIDVALKVNPKAASAFSNRGLALQELRRLDEALASYDKAIALKPDYAESFNNRGNALQELRRLDEALASYDKAIALKPDYAEAFNNRGNTLKEQTRLVEALASYDKAIALKPDYAAAFNNRGNTLRELERFDEALSNYNKAIGLKPDYPEAVNNRGLVLQELKRFDEALASYDRAIALKPDNAEVFNNRGIALKDLARLDEALASYDKTIALKPDYAEAFNNRGNALKELSRFGDALASYDKALALKPDSVQFFNNRGLVLKEMKRFGEALASYDKAIALKPDYAEVFNNRGLALKELKRLDEALASYDKSIALKPNYAEAFSNRGFLLQELKRFDEALASYDRAIALKPDLAEAHSNRGAALFDHGRLDEAVAACRQAVTLKPNLAGAHNNLGLALMQIGNLSNACEALGQAVRLAPRNAKYRRDLSDITHFDAGDPHLTAMEQLVRERASLSTGERIEMCFALAKAYEDVGRHAEAFHQWLDGNALKRRQLVYDEVTTLGALDSAASEFTAELIQNWQHVGHPSSIPVFIIGMPRSGTTLIEQILASHTRVFGGGELKYFSGAVQGNRTMRTRAVTSSRLAKMTGKDFHDIGARYVAEIERLAPSAARITDKMPMNFIFAGIIHVALPNAAIIHTIRDPIDTCLSCFSKLFTDEQNYTYDLAELGRYYRRYQTLMAQWGRVLPPGRILDVHYEDVVADLEVQARRIIAHCGLDWDPRCLTFHQTERPVRTASAAQVRRPIYNSAVGRWRVHEKSLGPLLAELGLAGRSNRNLAVASTDRVGPSVWDRLGTWLG